jgi:hypothetical protein
MASEPMSRQGGVPTRGRSSSLDLGQVRQWAKANGYQVSDRGRIAGALMEAYTAAHG